MEGSSTRESALDEIQHFAVMLKRLGKGIAIYRIGEFAFDANVRINEHTRIAHNVFIAKDVQIGGRCYIDPRPRVGIALASR